MELNFTNIVIIVFMQLTLLFLYHLITKKNKQENDILNDKLQMLNAILKSTNHEKIYTLEKIKEIELESDEVFVFSKDIYRDIKDDGQFSTDLYSISAFYETVKINLTNKKKYCYFLKKDANFRHSIISFYNSHNNTDNVDFYIIPSEKYFFYDEVYLYIKKDKNEVCAYEFLPSISNEKERRLFFIELDEKQTKRLMDIKNNLIDIYKESSIVELSSIKSKI